MKMSAKYICQMVTFFPRTFQSPHPLAQSSKRFHVQISSPSHSIQCTSLFPSPLISLWESQHSISFLDSGISWYTCPNEETRISEQKVSHSVCWKYALRFEEEYYFTDLFSALFALLSTDQVYSYGLKYRNLFIADCNSSKERVHDNRTVRPTETSGGPEGPWMRQYKGSQ